MESNIFQNKLEKSLEIKMLQRLFTEYKHMIQYCVGYFIEFIDFMLKGKTLLGYTNWYYPNEYKKNDKIILKYFNRI